MDEIEIAAGKRTVKVSPGTYTTVLESEVSQAISLLPDFKPMPKIGRLSRGCTITEKIDGTNASLFIGGEDPETTGLFLVGSRTRWITPTSDNYGFAHWAHTHKDEILSLGPGHHFGEWWGLGIQRRYGQTEKKFSLFNVGRWEKAPRPACVGVVPKLYEGLFTENAISGTIYALQLNGSQAAPGFMDPEGIVIYHHATKQLFKKTLKNDEQPKGKVEEA